MKIAFFDSGIGGLNVLREAVLLMPDEKYIYYADSRNAPYGIRPKEEVMSLTFEAVERIADQGIKALVVACNTATSIAIDTLREHFDFPIIGMEPAVKTAVEKHKDKKVLVLATPLTLRENKFHSLLRRLDSEDKVDILPLMGLVEFAESFIFSDDRITAYLEESFSGVDLDLYSSIVLGCTHFSFFKEQIYEITKNRLEIYDGNTGTAKRLANILGAEGKAAGGFLLDLYVSGDKITDGIYLDIIGKFLEGGKITGDW